MQNFSTKDCTKKKLEVELKSWFDNACDRGEGGRKRKQQDAPPEPVAVKNNVVNALPVAVNSVNALSVTTDRGSRHQQHCATCRCIACHYISCRFGHVGRHLAMIDLVLQSSMCIIFFLLEQIVFSLFDFIRSMSAYIYLFHF